MSRMLPMVIPPLPHFRYVQQSEERQAQRQRPVQACSECRRRKSKCDRQFPCTPCTLRGEQSICREYQNPTAEGLTGYTDVKDFDDLIGHLRHVEGVMAAMVGKIQRLESKLGVSQEDGARIASPVLGNGSDSLLDASAVGDNQPSSDADSSPTEPLHNSVHHNSTTSARPHDASSGQNATNVEANRIPGPDARDALPSPIYPKHQSDHRLPTQENVQLRAVPSISRHAMNVEAPEISRAPSLTDHHAALILEDLAFDRTNNVERHSPDEKQNDPLAAITDARSQDGSRAQQGHNPLRHIAMPDLKKLPDIMKATRIMAFFFSDVEWLFRCIHVPSFKQRIQQFMAAPIASPLTLNEVATLCVYAACLCTSLHLMEPNRLLETGYTQESRASSTADLSLLMGACFHAGDLAQSHRLEFIQAYIMIGPYWHSCGRSEAHWSLLGSMVKLAQNLGLSRLPAEPICGTSLREIRSMFGARWQLAADREVGRRVWWTLVELDTQFAPEHHFTTITHSQMSHTVLPANVDDEQLVGHGPVQSLPLTQYTGMSYFLNRIEWILPLQRLVEQMNQVGSLRYSMIQEAHRQFMKRADEEPAFFNIENPYYDSCATDALMLFNLRRERITLYLHGHLRVLRVHRLYLAQAIRTPEKYELSIRVALRAATFIIEHDWKATHGLPTRYWPVQYAALTATSALFHLYCHAQGQEEEKTLGNLVSAGIRILKASQGSQAIVASAETLQHLLEESSREAPFIRGSYKRKREDDAEDESRLLGLIKRVIRPSGLYPQSSNSAPSATRPPVRSSPWSDSYGYNGNENAMARPANHSTNMDVPVSNTSGGEYALPNPGLNQDVSSFWFWNYALPEWQLNPEDLGLSMPNWDVADSSRL